MKTICLLLAIVMVGCGKSEKPAAAEEESKPTHVVVETASRGAIDRVVEADAVLYPVDQSNVTPKISATVKRVLVNRGDHVRVGQLLAELESADLAASVEEAKQVYEQAQASYQTTTGATVPEDRTKALADIQAAQQVVDSAKKIYDSRAALEKEGALAQKLVDDANLALGQARIQLDTAQRHLQSLNQVSQRESVRGSQAQMNAAKARYDNALVQLSYARVYSPIAGVVADRTVFPGEMASSAAPLVSIVDISQVVARANVPIKDAAAITVGRPVRITGPNGDIAGKVSVVSPTANANSTTLEVWVKTPNPGEKLKPGGTVRLAIIAETIQNTLVVSSAALLNSDTGGQKVMVVGKDAVAHERMVSVGVRQGERVQIVSGVQDAEQVVVSGGLGLEDKAKVVIEEAKGDDDDDEDAAAEPESKTEAKGKDAKDVKGKK
jgi:multidrug efflux pump subunit AcrA (membrane-fusion protein)